MPAAEKLAVVSTALESPKVTVPGPDVLVHLVVTAPGGLGRPSSVTVPSRLALSGSVIAGIIAGVDRPTLRLKSGRIYRDRHFVVGRLVAVVGRQAKHVVAGQSRSSPSYPPRWRSPKLTVPGPDVLVHLVVTTPGGFGRPSSLTLPSRLAAVGQRNVRIRPGVDRRGRVRAALEPDREAVCGRLGGRMDIGVKGVDAVDLGLDRIYESLAAQAVVRVLCM